MFSSLGKVLVGSNEERIAGNRGARHQLLLVEAVDSELFEFRPA